MTGYARATSAVVGAVVALGLAGCSDDAGTQPGRTPSASSSAATTPSWTTSQVTTSAPTSAASVTVPAAARAHTEEGAKAFAEFYLRTYSESAVRADSAPLKPLSSHSCGGCNSLVKLIDGYKSKNQHVDRASLTVNDSMVRPEGSADSPVIDILAKDARKQVLNADGSVAQTVAAANINFRLTLEHDGDTWTVTDLRVVQ